MLRNPRKIQLLSLRMKLSNLTLAEKFNTYRFSDYKGKVIDLYKRESTVKVGSERVFGAVKVAQQ